MRLTKHRQDILNQLEAGERAWSASELQAVLPHINLVTIYRNLEAFAEAGLVKKMNFSGKEAQYEIQHTPHHHAVCTDCERVIHFTVADEKLKQQFVLPHFNINDIEITIRGHCTNKHHLQ